MTCTHTQQMFQWNNLNYTIFMWFDCCCACNLYQSMNGKPDRIRGAFKNRPKYNIYALTHCLHTYTYLWICHTHTHEGVVAKIAKKIFPVFEERARFFVRNGIQWTFCLRHCCVWLCSRSLYPFTIDTTSHTYQSSSKCRTVHSSTKIFLFANNEKK